jgi:hypothetical protein
VIGDPVGCRFDPVVLLRKSPETDACLTQPQLTAIQKIYSGPRNSTGERIFPVTSRGAKPVWPMSGLAGLRVPTHVRVPLSSARRVSSQASSSRTRVKSKDLRLRPKCEGIR